MMTIWQFKQHPLLFLLLSCGQLATSRYTQSHPSHQAYHPTHSHNRETRRKFFKFVTRPDIDAPKWNIRVHDATALEEGYWFVAPYQDLKQEAPGEGWVGPHIYDQNGELIWSGAGMFQHWNTFDFGETTIGGQHMLSILYPNGRAGIILDRHYRVHKRVGLDHIAADMHSFHLIDGGSRALVITAHHLNSTEKEAEEVGFYGKGGCRLAHVGFAELDVDNPAQLVFDWKAYQHIGLDEVTYNEFRLDTECVNRWDVLHANSIDKFADNDYLISARHSDTIYKVSHVDGSIVWRLGGVRSSFEFLGPGNAMFSRQHHARVLGQDRTHTIVSLFDNAIGTGPEEQKTNEMARGLILLLDTVQWTASILAEYKHPRGRTVSSRGSFQTLPNGNAFLCWTYNSRISEHSPNGTVIMEAAMEADAHTYRAFKHPWIGVPLSPPDVVAHMVTTKDRSVQTRVYVSWNGATEVDTWVVRRAHEDGTMDNDTLVSAEWSGFETTLTYRGTAEYVVVEALDETRNSLGRSGIVRAIPENELGTPEWYRACGSELVEHHFVTIAQPRPSHESLWVFLSGFVSCAAIVSLSLVSSRRRNTILMGRYLRSKRRSRYELFRSEKPESM